MLVMNVNQIRDAKIKVLGSLKQDNDEEGSEWKKLSVSLKSEYPKHTPLHAKILEGLLSQSNVGDKIRHEEQKIKKKMETTRDQLAEALYQKGIVLAEIETLKGEKTEGTKDVDKTDDQSAPVPDGEPDLFEDNFKELKKWVDVKSLKYGNLLVIRERRHRRLGTALKVLNDMTRDESEPPKKKLYELKISLLDEVGWTHLATYERLWMHVWFPPSLPLF